MNTPPLQFHILDCHIRDEIVEEETAETKVVSYVEDHEPASQYRGRKYNENAKVVIHLFGSCVNGQTVRCDVYNFEPFFYVKLPETNPNAGKRVLEEFLESKLGPAFQSCVVCNIVYKEELYGYTKHQKVPFLEIKMTSMELYYAIRNQFLYFNKERNDGKAFKKISLGAPFKPYEAPKLFESNLDPLLRFFHLRNLSPCNWVTVKNQSGPSGTPTRDILEYTCDVSEISPCENPPVPTAPFVLGSWDIETWSSTGEFPLAIRNWSHIIRPFYKASSSVEEFFDTIVSALRHEGDLPTDCYKLTLQTHNDAKIQKLEKIFGKYAHDSGLQKYFPKQKIMAKVRDGYIEELGEFLDNQLKLNQDYALLGDPVIQIGTIVSRLGSKDVQKHIFVYGTCDTIDGAVVHSFKTEKEMLLGWCKWVYNQGIDVLLGYNIFGFDEHYMWDRFCFHHIDKEEVVQKLNRLYSLGTPMTLESKELSSSAMGQNFLHLWKTSGILRVDLFQYIKRNVTLSSYKLDDTSRYFLGEEPVKVQDNDNETWTVYTKPKKTQKPEVGRSVVFVNDVGVTLCNKVSIVQVLDDGFVVQAPDDVEILDIDKWAVVKDDLSPEEMFRLHEGSSTDRAVIASYCIQDCQLVLDLFHKLEVFNNSMSMANVCSVPISYIFLRGQGIKIESLIFKFCYENQQCIEVLPNPNENEEQESYEGAIVLDPNPGFYTVPVGVADFASLYPSTIISENISHDTLVWAKDYDLNGNFKQFAFGSDAYDNQADVLYTDISFDILIKDPEDTRKNPAKIKAGTRICRYAQEKVGTIPLIVAKLLAQRKATRKKIASEPDPFRKALLDAEQLAYKVTANSLYGQLGANTFKIRLQHLAASVTAYGRKQIMFARDMIMEFYGPKAQNPRCTASGAETVYGDSVTGDTPLYLRKDGKPCIVRIDELETFCKSTWKEWHETKECIDIEGIDTWTERGWTPLHRLIRHKLAPTKKMYRILTHTGVVDCTEDHSLVDKYGKEIKPSDVNIQTELLHDDNVWSEFNSDTCDITEDEAWVMGLFLADGSCDAYNTKDGIKYTWAINKSYMNILEEAKNKLPFETKILDTLESSGVYKLVPVKNIKEPTLKYRNMFYNIAREKKVPDCILHAPINIVQSFMNGFYTGDGDKVGQECGNYRWDQKGKEVCSGLYILAKRLGYNVSVNDRKSKPTVFRITCTKSYQRKNNIAIKKMYEIPTENIDYVYDLQTENHHFSVGPGALVVHNTDSLFICFNPKDPATGQPLEGRAAVEATIHLTEEAGKLVSQVLKPPHDFEFDKVYWPFLIFSKKRYVGNMYESGPDEYVQKSMGIALKRRDYSQIVKKVFGTAVKIMLEENNVVKSAEFVKQACTDLVNGKYGMNKLIISKSLQGNYAKPEGIPHKILADRIAARDPGNAPAVGDRMSYVYILPPPGQEVSKLQGDRIETPQYVLENKLKLDYMHYIEHQISNPVCQLFGLLLEQLPGFQGPPAGGWNPNPEKALKQRESMAYDIIFRNANNASANNALKSFGEKFGWKVVPKTATSTSSRTVAVTPVNYRPITSGGQSTLDVFLMDKMMIKTMGKKPKKKEETEEGAVPPKKPRKKAVKETSE